MTFIARLIFYDATGELIGVFSRQKICYRHRINFTNAEFAFRSTSSVLVVTRNRKTPPTSKSAFWLEFHKTFRIARNSFKKLPKGASVFGCWPVCTMFTVAWYVRIRDFLTTTKTTKKTPSTKYVMCFRFVASSPVFTYFMVDFSSLRRLRRVFMAVVDAEISKFLATLPVTKLHNAARMINLSNKTRKRPSQLRIVSQSRMFDDIAFEKKSP